MDSGQLRGTPFRGVREILNFLIGIALPLVYLRGKIYLC